MKNGTLAGACALALVAAAQPASATIHELHFHVHSGSWEQNFGTGSPFGLPADPVLEGRVFVDDQLGHVDAIKWLIYSTGAQSWTINDLDPVQSKATSSAGMVQRVVLRFGTYNYVSLDVNPDDTTAQVSDVFGDGPIGTDSKAIFCNVCTSFEDVTGTPQVPEPSIWALMLTGFGLAGAALRRRTAFA